ncbi:MAG: Nif3-like dinuclear metal center hexameric protein [Candidatus Aminicenantes bacterium]|nr:Nif3-like dinuclear metal center hexameric protein [Candidatus Aminicenantes bacterium]
MSRGSSFILAGLFALLCLWPAGTSGTPASGPSGTLTARGTVERIRARVGVEWLKETVDDFKAGDPDAAVKGIVVTMFPTYEILEAAAASGHNFIICHEPAFYDHFDRAEELAGAGDKVLAGKKDFIARNGLVIWRFHDHWHLRKPDGILQGMVRVLGWDEFRDPAVQELFRIPETSLKDLATELKRRFGAGHVRVIGDPGLAVKTVAFLPGAPASIEQMRTLGRSEVDAVITGETREWETLEYARDAAAEGNPKALIVLGHVPSEEAGMEECARWLRTFIGEVPVVHRPSGEPFWILK